MEVAGFLPFSSASSSWPWALSQLWLACTDGALPCIARRCASIVGTCPVSSYQLGRQAAVLRTRRPCAPHRGDAKRVGSYAPVGSAPEHAGLQPDRLDGPRASANDMWLVEHAGTDATEAFDDIGHSNGAKKQLVEKCELKGELVGAPEKKGRASAGSAGGVVLPPGRFHEST